MQMHRRLDSASLPAYQPLNSPEATASGPLACAGIAIRQRVAPTGAALHWFFAADPHIGNLQRSTEG